MNPISSYQPFLIGQGQAKTGFFTYLESWVKPEDAFDTLENAYVYRGTINQRTGFVPYQSAPGNGGLVYIDNIKVGQNTSGGSVNSYSSASTNGVVFPKRPVVEGTVIIRTRTSAGLESFVDDGAGVLVGSLGDTGTINYTTGAWSLTLGGGRTIANNIELYGDWGYVPTQITTGTPVYNPIMGIKQFTSPTTGESITIVMDTRRASYYDVNAQSFIGLNKFEQVIWQQFGTATTTGSITTQWTNLAPFSVVVTDGTDTTTDNGTGSLLASGNISGGTVNYTTGVITVTWTAAIASGTQVTLTANLAGDYFTGNNSNFFNATNWRYNDVEGDYLYMTNNVDPVTLFDGEQLSRPLFNTTLASVQSFAYANNDTIKTCLDIKVYKNRLLFIRPTLLGSTIPEAQTVRYSQQQFQTTNPTVIRSSFNFAADTPGNGGFVNAPTGDWLMAAQLIRDVVIIFATNSTWVFRFTASSFDPYRFDQVNSTRATNAPYASVPYDLNATSMGAKGLISCDGTAVDRYDIPIIDQFGEINQSGFGQCFAQKYDTFNQTWMLYPNQNNTQLTNDRALVFNYLENTWSIFIPNLGALASDPTLDNALSCLGLGYNVEDITWADFAPGSGSAVQGLNWSQANFPWIGFATQTLTPVLLAGDQNGIVYQCYSGPTDNGNPIPTYINTKRFNPFVQAGQKARFGYLDIYYECNSEIQLSLDFYINNSQDAVKTTTITLDGPDGAVWNWKRVYLNCVGQFLQIGISNEIPNESASAFNTGGTFTILGMILHAAPAGRLTPGTFL